MATYYVYGSGASVFEAQGSPGNIFHDFAANILYLTPTEFGFRNADGSITYFSGTDFSIDPESGFVVTGTITGLKHFRDGAYIDEITGLDLSANVFWNTTLGVTRFFSDQAVLGGNDTIDARFRAGNAVIDTVLNGYEGDDTIYGGAGNDTLAGGYGADTIYGGAGNDTITDEFDSGPSFPAGNDRFFGEAGNDRLSGFDGNDVLNGGIGNDTLIGGRGSDTLNGNSGNDIIFSGTNVGTDNSRDILNGGAGTDTAIYRGSWSDLVITRTATGFTVRDPASLDTLTGIERIAADEGTYSFNATTLTWQRINTVSGEQLLSGVAPLNGTANADTLLADNLVARVVYGLGGDDTITGLGQSDLIFGGSGNDTLRGDGIPLGNSAVTRSNDRLYGEAGNDVLAGLEGDDTLNGGAGVDSLNGGRGSDRLTGGADADTFTFVYESNATRDRPLFGNDVITDFQLGVDRIVLNLNGAAFLTPALSLTADGWLLTTGDTSSTVLFKGLTTAGVTLDDLTLI
jgi:Ca2+-binding RTX toxin-like protein